MSKSIRDFTVGEIDDAKKYIPQTAYDIAYDLCDFASKYFGDCELSFSIMYWHRLKDSYDSVNVTRTIYYVVETHSVYHNDTETSKCLRIGDKTLALAKDRSFADPVPSIFSDDPDHFGIRHTK